MLKETPSANPKLVLPNVSEYSPLETSLSLKVIVTSLSNVFMTPASKGKLIVYFPLQSAGNGHRGVAVTEIALVAATDSRLRGHATCTECKTVTQVELNTHS